MMIAGAHQCAPVLVDDGEDAATAVDEELLFLDAFFEPADDAGGPNECVESGSVDVQAIGARLETSLGCGTWPHAAIGPLCNASAEWALPVSHRPLVLGVKPMTSDFACEGRDRHVTMVHHDRRSMNAPARGLPI